MPEPIVVMPSRGRLRTARGLSRRGTLLVGLALVTGGAGAGFERFLTVQPNSLDAATQTYRLDASRLPKPGDDPVYLPPARAYLVNLRPGEGGTETAAQGDLVGSEHGGLLALSERCPHRGCSVLWRAQFRFLDRTGWFRCPCCGSIFTKGRLRAFGPSPRAMDTVPLNRDRYAGLILHIRNVQPGGTDDPQRAVLLR